MKKIFFSFKLSLVLIFICYSSSALSYSINVRTACKDKLAFPNKVSGSSLSATTKNCSWNNRSRFAINHAHISSPPENEIIKGRDSVMSGQASELLAGDDFNTMASFFSTTIHDNEDIYGLIKANKDNIKDCFDYFYTHVEKSEVDRKRFFPSGEQVSCDVFSGDRSIRIGEDIVAEVDSEFPILVIGFLISDSEVVLNYIPAKAMLAFNNCQSCFSQ